MSELKDFLKLEENVENVFYDGNELFNFETNKEVENYAKKLTTFKTSADPFWDDMAALLLESIIFYVLAVDERNDQNLNRCLYMVSYAINHLDKGRYLTSSQRPSCTYAL